MSHAVHKLSQCCADKREGNCNECQVQARQILWYAPSLSTDLSSTFTAQSLTSRALRVLLAEKQKVTRRLAQLSKKDEPNAAESSELQLCQRNMLYIKVDHRELCVCIGSLNAAELPEGSALYLAVPARGAGHRRGTRREAHLQW